MKSAYFLITVSPKTQSVISVDGPHQSSTEVRKSFDYLEASGFTKTHLSYFEIAGSPNSSMSDLQSLFNQSNNTLTSLK